MLDFIGDVLTTIFSTFIIGLCGITIVDPLRSRLIIYKKILRVIRNFEDPRKLGDGFVPNTILIDNIKKQTEAIEAILDLVEEQKEFQKEKPKTIYEYSSGQQKAFSIVLFVLGIILALMSVLLIIGEMTVIGIIGIIMAIIFIKISRSYKKISETKKL